MHRTGRVVALYSVYNVEKLVRNSMTAMLPFVDEYHIHDGRYGGFVCPCGEDHDNSCDHTLDEVERFRASYPDWPVKVIQHKVMPEFDKRNAMFDAMVEGDLGAIVDDDEIFYGLPKTVREFAESGKTKAATLACLRWRHSFDPVPRFFIKTEGLRFVQMAEGSYAYSFADSEGRLTDSDYTFLPSVRLVNLYGTGREIGYREQSRDAAREAYNERGIQKRLPTGVTSRPS